MIYLVKAPGAQPIDHCKCEGETLVAYPGQMDCPWCGCGWLFSCWACRKSFVFATAIETPLTMDEIAEKDIRAFGISPTEDRVIGWQVDMRAVLGTLVVGARYVYLDGHVHRADADSLLFKGWYGSHALPRVPQSAEGVTLDGLVAAFSREYWLEAKARKYGTGAEG